MSNPFTSTGGHEVPVLDRTLEFWRKKLQRFRTMLFSQTGGGGGIKFYITINLPSLVLHLYSRFDAYISVTMLLLLL